MYTLSYQSVPFWPDPLPCTLIERRAGYTIVHDVYLYDHQLTTEAPIDYLDCCFSMKILFR